MASHGYMEYGLKVKQNANGKNITNNASIKYYDENIITANSKTVGVPQGNNTSKTIRVKSPNLDIQKSVDKIEYKVRRYYYI